MLDFLLLVLFFIVGLALGVYLLLMGRRAMALTTAIICLAATGSLLALIFLGENAAWELTKEPNWLLLGITIAAGMVGAILGYRTERLSAYVVGFFAGGYIGLWFYDIAYHLVINIAHLPEQTAIWLGFVILIIGGLVGFLLTRRSPAIAIILISVFMGTDFIVRALGLSPEKSMTAVISISLAILGLVVQYAQYLRDIKGDDLHLFDENGPAQTPVTEYFDLSN